MKKYWLVGVLAIAILATPMNALAAEDGGELQEDRFDQMLESMNPDNYGGAYVNENGDICITAINNEEVYSVLPRARGIESEDYIVETVEYSWSDLEEARDNLFEQAEQLDITAVGLNPAVNGLTVYLDDASEKNTQRIIEASSVPNIKFIENNPTSIEPMESIGETGETQARATSVKAGQYLKRKSNGDYWSSVGYRAKIGTQTGFITCAHGWEKGQAAYLADGTKLGNISQYSLTQTSDACFIPSNLAWGGLQDGLKATGTGNPLVGEKILFDGARHYQENDDRASGTIQAVDVTGKTDMGGSFKDAFSYDTQPYHGDSGAAVLAPVRAGSSKYKLIGFVMSQHKADGEDPNSDVFSWGTACKWNNVSKALGCIMSNS